LIISLRFYKTAMDRQKKSCILISSFNVSNLAGYLSNDEDFPFIDASVAPFGQVFQVLMQKEMPRHDIAVVWTHPEGIIKSFCDCMNFEKTDVDAIFKEVDVFASLLLGIRDKANVLFVPSWVVPSNYRGLGLLDMKADVGIANILMQMNIRLAENLKSAHNVYILDTQKWLCNAGKNAFNPKLWYMSKTILGNEVFKHATRELKSALNAMMGRSRKLIVLDLDDTLWGGIVGDLGWQNIKLGGHDPVGEAHVDFQKTLKALTYRGILLGIVSKNEESVALEAIHNHPEMVLRMNDFAGYRINWEDKAKNIVDLASHLNLGLQSVIFVDDNPVERARVREAVPEVFVPEWPEDKMLYKSALLNLNCFDTPAISSEDKNRTKMYLSEQKRIDAKSEISSLDDWLKTLEMKINVKKLNDSDLQRTVQLLNKTNQMNLTTRRMTESELLEWINHKDRQVWILRVSDKFGDSGLTGIISFEVFNGKGQIVDFVLSCRVMGRKVEETMLGIAIQHAQSLHLEEVFAKYIPTDKNKPCLDFWKKSGFECNERENVFYWKLSNSYPLPSSVDVIQE